MTINIGINIKRKIQNKDILTNVLWFERLKLYYIYTYI